MICLKLRFRANQIETVFFNWNNAIFLLIRKIYSSENVIQKIKAKYRIKTFYKFILSNEWSIENSINVLIDK